MIEQEEIDKFLSFVDRSGDCWIWLGGKRPGRGGEYGVFNRIIDGKRRMCAAHRFSYEAFIEPPGPFFVCHKCDNPPCVRPEHLFLGTVQDNVDDMFAKGRRQRKQPYKKKETRKARKLTYEEYLEIIEALKMPYWGQVNFLAKKYDVSHVLISHIKTGRWKPASISVRE